MTSSPAPARPQPVATFGPWLKRYGRDDLDLTQAELAARLCRSKETISDVERGKRLPSKDLAGRLAEVFGIAPEDRAAFTAFARRRRSASIPLPPSGNNQAIATVRESLRRAGKSPVVISFVSGGADESESAQVAVTVEVLDDLPGAALLVKLSPPA